MGRDEYVAALARSGYRRARRKLTALATAGLLIAGAASVVGATSATAAGSLLPSGPKTVDKATGVPGDSLTYQIPYFCASTVPGDTCNGMKITDVIPTFTDVFGDVRPLEVVSFTSNSQLAGVQFASPDRVVWTGINLVAGDSGAVTLVLRVPNGVVPSPGIHISNKAAIDSAGVIVETAPAETDITVGPPGVTVTKSNNKSTILLGSTSTYTIKVCPNVGTGHFPGGYSVSDTIPTGAEIVAPIANGGLEGPAGVVTWTITDANDPLYDPATGCFSRQIKLTYPGGAFGAGDSVTNNVTVTPAGSTPIGPVGDTDTIRVPEANIVVSKATDAGYYVKDNDPINFSMYFNNQDPEGNQGETTLQNIVMLDGPLPKGFELASVSPGQWSGGYAATIQVSSVGAGGPWTTVATSDGSAAQDVVSPVADSAMHNAADGTNRYVRWVMAGPVAKSFTFSVAGYVKGTSQQEPFLPDPGLPQTLTNCQSTSADANIVGTLTPITRGPACATNVLEVPQPAGWIYKYVDSGIRQPGETGMFTLLAANSGDATADMVVSAAHPGVLHDCMPEFLVFDSVELNGWTDTSPGSTTCAAGLVPLEYRYTSDLTVTPGSYFPAVNVHFHVSELGDPLGAAPPSVQTNTVEFTQDLFFHCDQTDCKSTSAVTIPVSSTLKSRKQVAGFFDAPLTTPVPYTNTLIDSSADTYPGGPIDWRIAVLNNGNADVKNFEIIDVLPNDGDTGVKVLLQNRFTQWVPILQGPIVAPADWLVEYSTSANPCRPQLNPIGDASACEAPNWTTSVTDYSTVHSFRLTLVGTGGTFDVLNNAIQHDDNVFERGEEIIAEFNMKAPLKEADYDTGGVNGNPYENLAPPEQVDATPGTQTNCQDYNNSGDDPASTPDRCPVARNSFAYGGTAFSPTGLFSDVTLGSEPPRVDVTVYGPPNNGIGDYVWFDTDMDGLQDSGELPVPGVKVELYMEDPANLGTFIPALDNDSIPVDPTFTDSAGGYSFWNLADGNYKVRFYPPAGYVVTTSDASGAPGVDEGGTTIDGSPNTNDDSDVPFPEPGVAWTETPSVQLTKINGIGEYDSTWDMGIFKEEYSLGNLVWIDDGAGTTAGAGFNDGIKDPGEAPVANVTMVLYAADVDGNPAGTVLGTTTTDSSGHYRFDHLLPGDYVVIVAASNFAAGGPLDKTFPSTGSTTSSGAADIDGLDHGLDAPLAGAIEPGGIVSNPVTLGIGLQPTSDNDPATNPESGEAPNAFSNRTIDFGFHRKVRIGNLVWLDGASGDAGFNNGLADAGEVPIGGVTVELWTDDGDGLFDPLTDTLTQSTVTNSDGNYYFEGVEPGGKYFAAIMAVPGPSAVQSSTVGTAAGDPQANDNNDDGEPVGAYLSVSNLITAPMPGAGSAAESDAIPAADGSADTEGDAFTSRAFPDTNSDLRIDFGFIEVPLFRLGNLVWIDIDKDGKAEIGEDPLPGVTVELYNSEGVFVTSVETGPEGKYLFENLVAGDYEVRIPKDQLALFGYKTSPDTAGVTEPESNTDLDNDDNGTLNDNGTATDMGDDFFTSGTVTLGEDAAGPGGEFDDEPTSEVDGLLDGTTDDDAGTAVSPDRRSNLTVDFGFYKVLVAIGNEVWLDLNDDGKQDGTEPNAPDGVVVNLLDGDGNPVLGSDGNPITTVTVDGRYLFDNLAEGVYIVEIAASNFAVDGPLEGWKSSTYNGVEDTIDRDDNGVPQVDGALRSAPFTLVEADETVAESPQSTTVAPDESANMTVDFGVVPLLSLGNEIWFDLDDSGTINGAEGYVPDGVVVNLLHADGSPVLDAVGIPLSTTTVDGMYLFQRLLAGDYIVEIPASEFAEGKPLYGTRSSTPTAGDTDVDRDDNGAPFAGGIRTGAINLYPLDETPGEEPDNDPTTPDLNENLTWDIGLVPLFSLGNEIWLDLDDSGIIDNGETYVPDGVIVNLLHGDGTPVLDANGDPVTTTTIDGLYLFDDLLAGDYMVELDAANFTATGVLGSARSSTSTASDDDVDHDDNAADSTNVDGAFVIRSGVVTLALAGEPLVEDPNNDDVTPDGNENLTWDIGVVPLYSIGNEVWIDADDNGKIDDGEPYAAAGVVLNLLDADGNPVLDGSGAPLTTTTMDGLYLFDRLDAGTYIVEVAASNFAPGGPLYGHRSSTPTFPEDGTDRDDNGSPIDPAAPYSSGLRSAAFTLGFGEEPTTESPDNDTVTPNGNENLTVDFGLYQAIMALGDIVWYDLDRNGIQDVGEKPVVGATAHLLMEDPQNPGEYIDATNADGGPVLDDTTDANGYYLFDNLRPGNYKVEFTHNQTGYQWTLTDAADPATDAADSDGMYLTDTDPVSLTDVIALDPTQVNVRPTTAADNTTYDMTLKASFVDPTIDSGIWIPLSMGDYVWKDINNDGIQGDPLIEPPVSGVKVDLFFADGSPATDANGDPVAQTSTSPTGIYVFDNLLPGTYYVVFSGLPDGYAPTSHNTGTDQTDDSDVNPETLSSDEFTLSPSDSLNETAPEILVAPVIYPVVDMGIFRAVSLGDLVWFDIDRDGIYEPETEDGLENVAVALLHADGSPVLVAGVPMTTTTDAEGRYSFTGLISGDYIVEFTLPSGAEWTKSNTVAAGDFLDSDVSDAVPSAPKARTPITTVSDVNPLTDGDIEATHRLVTDPSLDAGVWFPMAIGDYVWYDLAHDGVQDAGEKPVVGATVKLFQADGVTPAKDAAGVDVPVATTNADGLYVFDFLLEGTYVVEFTHNQPGYQWTLSNDTDATDSTDSDPLGAATDVASSTAVVTLSMDPALAPNVRLATTADDTTYGTSLRAAYIDPTNDAGIWMPLAVGDYVWYDVDHDGKQDEGELPVEGATVKLFDADGVLVGETATDGDGWYVFDGLPQGDYTIEFSNLPLGWSPTRQDNVTGDDALDSDADSTTGLTDTFTLTASDTAGNMEPNADTALNATLIDPTLDMGIFQAASLGDLVWYDANRDGIYDPATETPIEGVKVELLKKNDAGTFEPARDADNALIEFDTTDVDGRYSFMNLAGGTYQVVFHLPTGYEWTKANTPGDDSLDSDVTFTSGTQATARSGEVYVDHFTAAADNDPDGLTLNDPTIDAGVWLPMAIGDYVWYDLNRDGVQGDEEPVVGATVELLTAALGVVKDADGADVVSTTTDENGLYVFDNLLPGSYVVRFTHAQTGYQWTVANSGAADDQTDSDATFAAVTDATAKTEPITLADGALNTRAVTAADETTYGELRATRIDPTNDAGIWMPVAVGDIIWFDADHDGVQDDGETPVEGVTVTLTDAAGNPVKDASGADVAPFVTLADGLYVFDNLLPGDYKITFSTLPEGAEPTLQAAGDDTSVDSNPDPATLMTPVFTLAPTGGNMVANTDEAVTASMIDPTIDMGIWIPLAIGDIVWYDVDHNGLQDEGEDLIPGVTVTLLDADGNPATDADGNPVAAVTTDENGHYVFDNLIAGDYKVLFEAPEGFIPTLQAAGDDDTIDSNPDTTGVTPVFTLTADGTLVRPVEAGDGTDVASMIDPTIDAGFWVPLAIGDYVWYDLDNDGVQEEGEEPVEGVKVELLDADGNPALDADGEPVASTTTDENGHYVFDNLISGDYKVRFSELPDGYEFTVTGEGTDATDSNPDATGVTPVFTLSISEANVRDIADADGTTVATMIDPTIDAGIWIPMAIGNYVWFDDNVDGIQGADEEPIENVKVELLDADGNVLATTMTDADGWYVFDGLPAGEYKLRFSGWPSDYELTKTGEGDDTNDSNPDPTTGETELFTLTPDGVNMRDVEEADGTDTAVLIDPTFDAGIFQPLAVGTTVWIDTDKDGVQDANEPGVPGVKVELFNKDGSAVVDAYGNPVGPLTTDEDGNYLFDNLLPGEYYIEFTAPPGYTFTGQMVSDGAVVGDSNASTTGKTPVFELTPTAPNVKPGAETDPTQHIVDLTIDAGLVKIGTTGGTNGGGALANSGSQTMPIVLLGVGLLGAGGLFVLTNRRRRRASATPER